MPGHVAVIILAHNSEREIPVLVSQMARQVGIACSTILVDNASRPASLAGIRTWLASAVPDAVCGSEEAVHAWVREHAGRARAGGGTYLIEHPENRGYSAGNNLGIRLAEALQADAVLITNPDMRIEDPRYVAGLARRLLEREERMVAASRILGPDGTDLNPLREPAFWEELWWPRWLVKRWWPVRGYVTGSPSGGPCTVAKVLGCCLMIRMSFLRRAGFLDEGVFLYCEEPILAAKVKAAGGTILFEPDLTAMHDHAVAPGPGARTRMLRYVRSRLYYLERYSGYGPWRLALLRVSYGMLRAGLVLFKRDAPA